MARAAQYLWDLASQPQPIEEIQDLRPWLSYIPRTSTVEPRFSRAWLELRINGTPIKLIGGYWDSRAVVPPLSVDVSGFPVAYVGVDSQIIEHLRAKRFDAFLSYEQFEGVFQLSQTDQTEGTAPLQGVVVLQSDGTAHGWLSRIPQGEVLSTEEHPPGA